MDAYRDPNGHQSAKPTAKIFSAFQSGFSSRFRGCEPYNLQSSARHLYSSTVRIGTYYVDNTKRVSTVYLVLQRAPCLKGLIPINLGTKLGVHLKTGK